MAVIKAGAGVSQANDDILRRLAAAQEEAPSSTGDTSLAVSSERSIVIAPPGTEASGYNIESTASTIEDEKRSEAFGGTEEEESTQSWLGTVEDRSGGGGVVN